MTKNERTLTKKAVNKKSMSRNVAIFLDRDGTIIKDKGYISKVEQVDFYKFTFSALKEVASDYLLFIITNQQGVGKGIISKSQLSLIHDHISRSFVANGLELKEIYYCPHLVDDNCSCRKPEIEFIQKAEAKYNLDLKNSFIIGDHISDAICGINAGLQPIYLLTGHGLKHKKNLPPQILPQITIKKSLKTAIEYIVNSKSIVSNFNEETIK